VILIPKIPDTILATPLNNNPKASKNTIIRTAQSGFA